MQRPPSSPICLSNRSTPKPLPYAPYTDAEGKQIVLAGRLCRKEQFNRCARPGRLPPPKKRPKGNIASFRHMPAPSAPPKSITVLHVHHCILAAFFVCMLIVVALSSCPYRTHLPLSNSLDHRCAASRTGVDRAHRCWRRCHPIAHPDSSSGVRGFRRRRRRRRRLLLDGAAVPQLRWYDWAPGDRN